MKKYIKEEWAVRNPFKDNYPVLEAPVSQPLPMGGDPSGVGIPGGDPGVPTPGIGPDRPPTPNPDPSKPNQSNAPKEPGQEEMPGMDSPEQDFSDEEFDEDEAPIDFETEKIDYMNLALHQKNDEMMDKLLEMRDIPKLSPGQYKFIEDNLSVLSLGRDVDFADAQKKIYKQIKDNFEGLAQPSEETSPKIPEIGTEEKPDSEIPEIEPSGETPRPEVPSAQASSMQGMGGQPEISGGGEEQLPAQFASYNPGWNLRTINLSETPLPREEYIPSNMSQAVSGVELYSILSSETEQYPNITNTMVKLPSFYSMKSDLYRKVMAALMNGVQIGAGGTLEDLFIPIAEGGIGIKVCTRCYTDFGNVQIGKWSLQFNDPENYLSDAELEKLNDTGSPEEKEVLHKRVVVESIAEAFKDKVYLVLISDPNDGTRYEIGFNFSDLIRDGWKNGYISIDFKANVGKGEAGVQIDGEMIDLQNIVIEFVRKNASQLDEEGLPSKEYIELMKLKNGYLYLVITGQDFSDFANISQTGLFYSEKQFDSGPEELHKIQRCVPDIKEIILKQC